MEGLLNVITFRLKNENDHNLYSSVSLLFLRFPFVSESMLTVIKKQMNTLKQKKSEDQKHSIQNYYYYGGSIYKNYIHSIELLILFIYSSKKKERSLHLEIFHSILRFFTREKNEKIEKNPKRPKIL